MDCVQMGRFIAQLRKEAGMTQEQLGQKLGVTNKTISRWENGNYLPDIAMFRQIGALFDVTVEELLDGRRWGETGKDEARIPAKQAGEETPSAGTSVFSRAEQTAFWKKKWLREHRSIRILLAAAYAVGLLLLVNKRRPVLVAILAISALGANAFLRNRMMAYVEERVYCR